MVTSKKTNERLPAFLCRLAEPQDRSWARGGLAMSAGVCDLSLGCTHSASLDLHCLYTGRVSVVDQRFGNAALPPEVVQRFGKRFSNLQIHLNVGD